MKYVIYLSTAVNLMTEQELEDILTKARFNNSIVDITGIMLYSGGTFIQVLEGMPEPVDKLLKTIENDPRHKNLMILIEEPLEKRNFSDWSMGYSSLNENKIKELAGCLKSTSSISGNESSATVFSILKTFMDTNKMVINS